LIVQLDAEGVVEIEITQPLAHRRMENFGNRVDLLDIAPDHAVLGAEERRRISARDVDILVDGGRQNGAALVPVPFRIVASAPEEGYPERRPTAPATHTTAPPRDTA